MTTTPDSAWPSRDSFVFNPPPGWATPPGFFPEQGWAPDPSWPPAPTGWVFWTPIAPAPAAARDEIRSSAASSGESTFLPRSVAAPRLKPVAAPYWSRLLFYGFVLSILGGIMLGVWASKNTTSIETDVFTNSPQIESSSGPEGLLLGGIAASSIGGTLLLAGVIGLGVASAGIRPALDRLIDLEMVGDGGDVVV